MGWLIGLGLLLIGVGLCASALSISSLSDRLVLLAASLKYPDGWEDDDGGDDDGEEIPEEPSKLRVVGKHDKPDAA